jgi:NAD-dependent deacetylase
MKLFVLTGAGVSAESGLGTFRDKGGLWEEFDPMTLATPEAFARDPERVHAFYNLRRRNLQAARPNAAHVALARLEATLADSGGSLFLCTQNIDDLHEQAGSRAVHHMHGELLKARCGRCGRREECRGDLSVEAVCEGCRQTGGMRPDVVWFGEMPLGLDRIDAKLADADLFVGIGTSGAVYPAAGYVAEARAFGIPTVELNLEPSDNARVFDDARYGPATEVVPAFVDAIIAAPWPRASVDGRLKSERDRELDQ